MIVINQVKWGRHSGECDSPGHQLLLCIPWLFVLARIPLIRRQLITFVVKITKYLWSLSDQIEENFNWNLIRITISVSSKRLIQFIQIIGQRTKVKIGEFNSRLKMEIDLRSRDDFNQFEGD